MADSRFPFVLLIPSSYPLYLIERMKLLSTKKDTRLEPSPELVLGPVFSLECDCCLNVHLQEKLKQNNLDQLRRKKEMEICGGHPRSQLKKLWVC